MLHAMNDIICGKTKPVQCLWDIICDRICQEAWGVLPTHGQDNFQQKNGYIIYYIYAEYYIFNIIKTGTSLAHNNCHVIEGSLEVKLPTIWTDEKQSRAVAERRGRLEERRSEEKE